MKGAAFDSHDEEHEAICHPGTRFDLLHQIDEWADNPAGKGIYWLQGKAGTGKSTISRTVAHKFATEKRPVARPVASFFFKRGEGDRGKAAQFFTTIAAQLVRQSPAMAEHVRNAIQADPTVPEKGLNVQFDKLILEPLKKVHGDTKDPLKNMVVVIDALDECDNENDVNHIINLLSQATALTSVCLRFFVTSRPESPIRVGFKRISGSYTDRVLHDIPVEHDIEAFLKYEFTRIRDHYDRILPEDLSLPSDWPGQKNIQILVQMAVPLFIFAATVCRFVNDRTWSDPVAQLTKVLDYQTRTSDSELDKLDATYLPILNQLIVKTTGLERKRLVDQFRNVVGSIILLAEPLSRSSLSRLLDISTAAIAGRLNSLHSVLNIPSNPNAPIKLFHLSFRDFLVKPNNRDTNEFWVDEKEIHRKLATRCFKLLDRLTEDICDLQMPGKPREDIDKQIIDRCLPPEVQYACLYWTYHLKESKDRIRDEDQAHQFLTRHFLHWLEALSLIGKISESNSLIGTLQSLIAVS